MNSKLIKKLNVRDTTLTLLKENRYNVHDQELGTGFLDMATKAQTTKEKIR